MEILQDLTPLSDDERRAALDEFDFDSYTRRLIGESLRPALVTAPSWQWAGDIKSQSATYAKVLVKLCRGDKP